MTTPSLPEGCLLLDLSGMFCPQVVLEVAGFVKGLAPGVTVFITSTDPLSSIDLPLFSMRSGHVIERYPPELGRYCYLLTLGYRESAG